MGQQESIIYGGAPAGHKCKDHQNVYKCAPSRIRVKIQQANDEYRYYYIGYAGREDDGYICRTVPKSEYWKKHFRRKAAYYADITGPRGVTEKQLIAENKGNGFCVNGLLTVGKSETTGFVYVLFGQKIGT